MRVLLNIILFTLTSTALAATTITYQGKLETENNLFDGEISMAFELYDAIEDGTLIAGPILFEDVSVTDGLFQVPLDFGDVYGDGPVFLAIYVNDDLLEPLQQVRPAPLAINVLKAPHQAWSVMGNSGMNTSENFLGTTDNVGLAIAVNNRRAVFITPAGEDMAPNIVAGFEGNTPLSTQGVTISGGGSGVIDGVSGENSAASYAVVSGGWGNQATAESSTISGGNRNAAQGVGSVVGGGTGNTSEGADSTVSGGLSNQAGGLRSTIGGGRDNIASGEKAVIGGGTANQATEARTTVAGGSGNQATANEATVGGGISNFASEPFSVISGGRDNQANGQDSVISGGHANIGSGGSSTISGGSINQAVGSGATISGGSENMAVGDEAAIGGGLGNEVTGNQGTVSGGWGNTAAGFVSTVGGGYFNIAGQSATVAGGDVNVASAERSTVGGGGSNQAEGDASTIVGGFGNQATGHYSIVAGGRLNSASSDHSFAAGHRAKVDSLHVGSFLWSDSMEEDFPSEASNEFAVRASGGIRFVVDNITCRLNTATGGFDCAEETGGSQTSLETLAPALAILQANNSVSKEQSLREEIATLTADNHSLQERLARLESILLEGRRLAELEP